MKHQNSEDGELAKNRSNDEGMSHFGKDGAVK
jgi:hypothetical protein